MIELIFYSLIVFLIIFWINKSIIHRQKKDEKEKEEENQSSLDQTSTEEEVNEIPLSSIDSFISRFNRKKATQIFSEIPKMSLQNNHRKEENESAGEQEELLEDTQIYKNNKNENFNETPRCRSSSCEHNIRGL